MTGRSERTFGTEGSLGLAFAGQMTKKNMVSKYKSKEENMR